MRGALVRFWEYFLEILFPPICIACKNRLDSEKERKLMICSACFASIPIFNTISYSPRFSLAAVSSYENDAVKELLHSLKYKRFLKSLVPINELIKKYFEGVNLEKIIASDFIIVPIPLHKKRFRERGFNQAEEIAKLLAQRLNLEVMGDVLIKTLDTKHQTNLKNKEDRLRNVRGSFSVAPKVNLQGRNIVVVDDVYTTGSTINEAVKILKRSGAGEIFVFVVAKTL